MTDPVSVPEPEREARSAAGPEPPPEGGDWARIKALADANAPFIPPSPEDEPLRLPPKPWEVFRAKGFPRLFAAQVVSSIGDWTGIVAILALAGEISTNAVGLVLVARMLPGFIFAPLGGALADRWNRKAIMVTSDIGRAALLAVLPFWDGMLGLVVISFWLEVFTLLWGPAKDATVPNIVKDPDQLGAANSFGLFAGFGMFPLGSLMFAVLAAVSSWLSNFDQLRVLRPEQASLAIWIDALTFVCSAILISGLTVQSRNGGTNRELRVSGQIWREVGEGLTFIRSNPMVRGVMVGLAGGLIGGGCIVPLGAVFAKEVLGAEDQSAFGFLMTAFGFGAVIGVVSLLWLQRRLPRPAVFTGAVVATGTAIIVLAWLSTLGLTIMVVGAVGAGAGCAYVTGFTLLQESVSDEMRGRIFGALYTVVRLSLLLSLTISPFVASALGALSDHLVDGELSLGSAHVAIPGVRLALILGGSITVVAGMAAARRMRKVSPAEAEQ